MFDINIMEGIEELGIHLATPSGHLSYPLNDNIDPSTAYLTIGLNQRFELYFDIIFDKNSSCSLTICDSVQEGMYLFVEKVGLFRINPPSIINNGEKITKSITAYGCDIELDDKTFDLLLNMGTKNSQEYLVTYDEDETELLLNPYTDIPYDWLVLYNTFPEQLIILQEKYDNEYYGTKDKDGSITVTNDGLISELDSILSTVPRLKNKLIVHEDSKGLKTYSSQDYIRYVYDDNGKILSITLLQNFSQRISELIVFYQKYRDQLSLLTVVLGKTENNWTVGNIYGIKDGDFTLANTKCQFESQQTIYSFLTQELSKAIKCVVDFDIYNRKVNIIPAENIGNDTGIVLSYDNLINELNIAHTEDTFCTRLYVTGANDLSIEQVNFGLPYIDDITYKLNARGENGERIYVSDDLAEKYMKYIDFREEQRKKYIQCTKEYNDYDIKISEIKNRVPRDSLKTDWGTYSMEELNTSLTTYRNLLTALITLYKEDFSSVGLNSDGSVNENYIKTTMYWYDYAAYKSTIIEIECAISTFPNYSNQDKWSDKDSEIYKNLIKAWETDWTLYGTIELQAKIDSYTNNMDILAESSVIRIPGSDEIKEWDALSESEKASYGNLQSNYYYDIYMDYYNHKKSAQEYLNTLLNQITGLEKAQSSSQRERKDVAASVALQNNFTTEECKLINRLYKDSSYTNENILTTNINNTVSSVDIMCELLEDGKEKLSIYSRPQLQFSTQMDNFLGMPEFQPLWDQFIPGNFLFVQYRDDTYAKLRLMSFTFNPFLPSDRNFTVTFSNYLHSNRDITDIESVLNSALGYTSDYSSTSGSSSDNTYGESDDIDVTISNTMLAKLLKSETFGTAVSNVILDTLNVNAITAKSATFGGLSDGTTIIDGKCLKTGYIIDSFYNGTNGEIDNTTGSVINLETGLFSMAGGELKWNGSSLKIKGDLIANTLSAGGKTSAEHNVNGLFIDKDGNLYSGINNETQILSNGKFSFGNGNLTWDGEILRAVGAIFAESGAFGKISPFTIGDFGINGQTTSSSTSSSAIFRYEQIKLFENDVCQNDFSISVRYGSPLDLSNNITLFLSEIKLTLFYRYDITKQSVEDSVQDDVTSDDNGTTNVSSSTVDNITISTVTQDEQLLIDVLPEEIDVTDSVVVSIDGSRKVYTYTYIFDQNNNSESYFKNLILENDSDLPSEITAEDLTIYDASVTVGYGYYFKVYEISTHIGTDYFKYSDMITVRDGKVTLGHTSINDELIVSNGITLGDNSYIKSSMSNNSYWKIYGSDSSYLEISSSGSNIPIYIRQYEGQFSKIIRTCSLLDKNGNTAFPGTLSIRSIKSNSEYLTVESSTIFTKPDTYIGDPSSTFEKRLRFSGRDETCSHDVVIYGGNCKSNTGLGIYDKLHKHSVLFYNDSSNSLYIGTDNFFFKDYSDTNRRPVSSATTNTRRISYISSKADGISIGGQWGSNSFSTRSLPVPVSDIRLKENITECEVRSALNIVMNMKLHSFDWTDERKHQKIGFIADELELIDSHLVRGGGYLKDGSLNAKCIDDFYLLGYLTKAIQELYRWNCQLSDEIKRKNQKYD